MFCIYFLLLMPSWNPCLTLPSDQAYDIVGDIHGELEALESLLLSLGYHPKHFTHPEGRKLLFIGDFVDRGPHSLEVLQLVQRLIAQEQAYAILGNHELNTLLEDAKPGSGWVFPVPANQKNQDTLYAPYRTITPKEQQWVMDFLLTLPVTLEHESLRCVHACWHSPSVDKLKKIAKEGTNILSVYQHFSAKTKQQLESFDWYDKYLEERHHIEPLLYEAASTPAFCPHIAQAQVFKQMNHPIKVLTGGMEALNSPATPFFAQKWRFAQRVAWWQTQYSINAPLVIFGHYWRKVLPSHGDLFGNTPFDHLLGQGQNAFCVDFSIGLMFLVRKQKAHSHSAQLAALRIPEMTLHFHNGNTFTLQRPS